MPTEEEKRLHRCCFSGHRPEKLNASTEQVKTWLEEKIDEAIADGYATFISGCAMGVDIWSVPTGTFVGKHMVAWLSW